MIGIKMKLKLLMLSSLIALTACSNEHDDLQSWMKEQRNQAKSKVKPVEKPAPMERQPYFEPNFSGPHAFSKSKMRSASASANAPDINRTKEFLEQYSLENLKFVGAIGTKNNMSGLIDVQGHIYTVKPGHYLGQNYGKITRITSDGIDIIEVVEDADGNWVNRPVTLTEKPIEPTK